ncbi:dephospho-CoA kinase [Flavobacteriaceae bacterium]|nr:dephospho-CoA kinase [Flavobacteriaceae bacterium]
MIVAITGGIGSGKTFVAEIFESMGCPIYIADDRAKDLMISNEGIISDIKALFGAKSYNLDGSLNRRLIADLAFGNSELLGQLNKIVHPRVYEDFSIFCKNHSESPVIVYESALVLSANKRVYDKLIGVIAPKYIRLKRVMSRDGLSEIEVENRMEKQVSDQRIIEASDFLIENDGKTDLKPQVIKILDLLKN